MKGYHRFQCKQYAHVYLLVTFPSYVSVRWNTESITGNQYVNKNQFYMNIQDLPKRGVFWETAVFTKCNLQSCSFIMIYFAWSFLFAMIPISDKHVDKLYKLRWNKIKNHKNKSMRRFTPLHVALINRDILIM